VIEENFPPPLNLDLALDAVMAQARGKTLPAVNQGFPVVEWTNYYNINPINYPGGKFTKNKRFERLLTIETFDDLINARRIGEYYEFYSTFTADIGGKRMACDESYIVHDRFNNNATAIFSPAWKIGPESIGGLSGCTIQPAGSVLWNIPAGLLPR
jgi:hypothetical protein